MSIDEPMKTLSEVLSWLNFIPRTDLDRLLSQANTRPAGRLGGWTSEEIAGHALADVAVAGLSVLRARILRSIVSWYEHGGNGRHQSLPEHERIYWYALDHCRPLADADAAELAVLEHTLQGGELARAAREAGHSSVLTDVQDVYRAVVGALLDVPSAQADVDLSVPETLRRLMP